MEPNPYEAPKGISKPRNSNALTGWALAKDTGKLLVIGLIASVVGVPVLFIAVAVLYGILHDMGLPLPNL